MNQKEFTTSVLKELIAHFPDLKGCYTVKESDVADIEIKSEKGNAELWITTQDLEITIGITSLNRSLTDSHFHITPSSLIFLTMFAKYTNRNSQTQRFRTLKLEVAGRLF